MKNLKFIYLAFILAIFTLTSCENNDPIVDITNTNQSASARSSMSELQDHFTPNGQLRTDNNPTNNIVFDFCFDFQFPMTFSYNTGANVTVNSFEDLVTILVAMTDTLYIDGVVFPFNVEVFDDATNTIIVQTINNEQEFETLVNSCDFDDVDDCVCTADYNPVCVELEDVNGEEFNVQFINMCEAECEGFTQADIVDCDDFNPGDDDDDDACFEFNYPISITDSDGTVIVINSDEDWQNALYSLNYYDFVFPFDVTLLEGNVITTITNTTDFETLLSTCYDDDDCYCPEDPNPVCVEVTTPTGTEIVEFDNMCEAECEGYTQADIVDCTDDDDDCIENLTVTLGDCIDANSYEATFNFTATGFTGNFSLYTRNDVLFAVGSMNDLPLTLTMSLSGFDEDYIKVVLDSSNSCETEQEWYAPNCNNTVPCWDFAYPVNYDQAGTTVTANDRAEFDNGYNPATSTLIYPFDVIVDGQTMTMNSPNDFFILGEFDRMCE